MGSRVVSSLGVELLAVSLGGQAIRGDEEGQREVGPRKLGLTSLVAGSQVFRTTASRRPNGLRIRSNPTQVAWTD